MNEEKLTKEEREVYDRVNTFAVSQFKIKNAINKCLTGGVNLEKLEVLMSKAKKLLGYGLKTDKMLDEIFDKTKEKNISTKEVNAGSGGKSPSMAMMPFDGRSICAG